MLGKGNLNSDAAEVVRSGLCKLNLTLFIPPCLLNTIFPFSLA